MAIKIFIDQGHNPVNPTAGAEGFGLREQDITYDIGMRLATTSLKSIFLRWQNYVAVGVKQILFPLFVYAVVFLLPLKQELRQAAVIIASCPVATLVLSFAEMLGEGQKTAAGIVLLGTTCAAITMPLITMLL